MIPHLHGGRAHVVSTGPCGVLWLAPEHCDDVHLSTGDLAALLLIVAGDVGTAHQRIADVLRCGHRFIDESLVNAGPEEPF